jgi:hypothetical protein
VGGGRLREREEGCRAAQGEPAGHELAVRAIRMSSQRDDKANADCPLNVEGQRAALPNDTDRPERSRLSEPLPKNSRGRYRR